MNLLTMSTHLSYGSHIRSTPNQSWHGLLYFRWQHSTVCWSGMKDKMLDENLRTLWKLLATSFIISPPEIHCTSWLFFHLLITALLFLNILFANYIPYSLYLGNSNHPIKSGEEHKSDPGSCPSATPLLLHHCRKSRVPF